MELQEQGDRWFAKRYDAIVQYVVPETIQRGQQLLAARGTARTARDIRAIRDYLKRGNTILDLQVAFDAKTGELVVGDPNGLSDSDDPDGVYGGAAELPKMIEFLDRLLHMIERGAMLPERMSPCSCA